MARNQIVAVERLILTVRGQRVILASDLAAIYGVETRALNQAVKRNADRFPPDFAFRLSRAEAGALLRSRSQSVILKRGQNIKYAPLAFTEHGAVLAATVLNSPRAVQTSIFVVRAFLRPRAWVAGPAAWAERAAPLLVGEWGHSSQGPERVANARRGGVATVAMGPGCCSGDSVAVERAVGL